MVPSGLKATEVGFDPAGSAMGATEVQAANAGDGVASADPKLRIVARISSER